MEGRPIQTQEFPIVSDEPQGVRLLRMALQSSQEDYEMDKPEEPQALELAAVDGGKLAREVRLLRERMTTLENRVEELISQVHETVANLDLLVVDGYIVKVWPDLEIGEWVAECPKVGTAVQESTRDEAIQAIGVMIREMLDALNEWGQPVPAKDV